MCSLINWICYLINRSQHSLFNLLQIYRLSAALEAVLLSYSSKLTLPSFFLRNDHALGEN